MKLENLQMHPFSTTMMGVLKGVLDYYGIEMSDALAFGGSGHAFLINIHEIICPSGPYCWKYDGFVKLARNLGLEMIDLGFFHAGNSPNEREKVERAIKEHLDQGRPCSLANMEHQMIPGYDDQKLFTAQPWPKCTDFPPATLTFGSWAELGKEVHINFFAFKKLAKKDDATIARDSLRHAIELFRNPEKYSQEHYGIGLRAYDNWAKAVEAGHGSSHGNWWNAQVWSECRAMAADYFAEGASKSKGDIAARSRELSQDYKEIADLLKRIGNKEMPAGEKVGIIHDLRAREEKAVRKIEEFVQFLGNT